MGNATQENRAYSAAHFVLELDEAKNKVGFCRSIQGGGIKTDILTYKAGSTHSVWRQLGKPKYEDITVEIGMAMSESFYNWIEAFFRGEVLRKTGALVACDFEYLERSRREFFGAMISELTFPKLDATDTNACYMTIKIVPETMEYKDGSNQKYDVRVGDMQQKLWTPSNFELKIDGFDQACRRVTKVDKFVIKQEIIQYALGAKRDPLKIAGHVEYPNITFYVPEADAKKFQEHFDKRVIDGEPPPATRMNGSIALRDHKGENLAEINLSGIDISNASAEQQDAKSDQIKMIKVEISIEKMEFKYGTQVAR